jgi:hypothetical protein
MIRSLTKTQQLLAATSLDRHCELVQKTKPRTTRYQVILKFLITDTVIDVVECVPMNFVRVCKDINSS